MKDSSIDEVVGVVLTASRVLVAVSARSLAKIDDSLTLAQFRCLVVLHGRGPLNLNGVADALGVRPSTAVRTVDRLVAAGYAHRNENPENRREVVLAVTKRGHGLVEDVSRRRSDEIAGILQRMSNRRRSDLVTAFKSFAAAADEPAAVLGDVAALGW